MIVKEKDSNKYSCPCSIARTNSPIGCMGSVCMAWEWTEKYDDDGNVIKDTGYCGLVGNYQLCAMVAETENKETCYGVRNMRYTKLPVTVDAWQWDGGPLDNDKTPNWILAAFNDRIIIRTKIDTAGDYIYVLRIKTIDNIAYAHVSDWIIRGVEGEFYPCTAKIFAKTYSIKGSDKCQNQ